MERWVVLNGEESALEALSQRNLSDFSIEKDSMGYVLKSATLNLPCDDEVKKRAKELIALLNGAAKVGGLGWKEPIRSTGMIIKIDDDGTRSHPVGRDFPLAWNVYANAIQTDGTVTEIRAIDQTEAWLHRASDEKVKDVVTRFGQDSAIKIMFIVEGETEIQFLQRFCELKDIDLHTMGVDVICLYGVQGLKDPRMKQHAEHVQDAGACIMITVDDEQDASQQLSLWEQAGFIDWIWDEAMLDDPEALPIGGLLWKPCFEEANFTFDELFSTWLATINPSQDGVDDDQEALALKREIKQHHTDNPHQTWIYSIEAIAKKRRLPFKKTDLARELANRYTQTDKPIVRLIDKIYQLAGSLHNIHSNP